MMNDLMDPETQKLYEELKKCLNKILTIIKCLNKWISSKIKSATWKRNWSACRSFSKITIRTKIG